MLILDKPIKKDELLCQFGDGFSDMVKFVVDLKHEIIVFDAEMHADLEQLLLEKGSIQEDLWGGNYYISDGRVEHTSLINIRPRQNNRNIEIENAELRGKIETIIKKLIL